MCGMHGCNICAKRLPMWQCSHSFTVRIRLCPASCNCLTHVHTSSYDIVYMDCQEPSKPSAATKYPIASRLCIGLSVARIGHAYAGQLPPIHVTARGPNSQITCTCHDCSRADCHTFFISSVRQRFCSSRSCPVLACKLEFVYWQLAMWLCASLPQSFRHTPQNPHPHLGREQLSARHPSKSRKAAMQRGQCNVRTRSMMSFRTGVTWSSNSFRSRSSNSCISVACCAACCASRTLSRAFRYA